MDIEQAYNKMLSALPFEERGIAEDLVESSRLNKESKSAWRRAPNLTLGETIDSIVQEAGFVPRRINLYCDTLEIESGLTIDHLNDTGLRIAIYARVIISDNAAAFSIFVNDRSAFTLYATEVPSDFQVVFVQGSKKVGTGKRFVPDKDKFGISAEINDSEISITMEDGPDVDSVDGIDYLKQVGEDGKLIPDMWVDDNLPRLLQFQFLVATTQIDTNRALALRLLNFVCTATNVDSCRGFNLQATALRCSVQAKQGAEVALVPSVNVFESKNVLQARLGAASNFEKAFQEFVAQDKSSKQLRQLAANALSENKNALAEYAFLEENARNAYEDASNALEIATENFKEKHEELDELAKNFEQGVQSWSWTQKVEIAQEIILGIVEVAGVIMATVLTGGGAAPVAIGVGATLAIGGGTVSRTVRRVKEVFTKIKALYEKFKPLLESVGKLVEAIKRMVEVVQQAKDFIEQPKELERADASIDAVNGMAMWDAFTVDVDLMFEGLDEYEIDGKSEYKQLLLHLPIFAKAVLAAEVGLVTAGHNLVNILLRKRLEGQQQDRLQKSIKFISQDNDLLDILKRAMFDRVLAVRNLVYMDFWQYKAAFRYYSLCRGSDLNIYISPVQRIADYQADAARMQAAVSSFGATVRIQSKSFVFHVPFEEEQRVSLNSGKGDLKYHPSITAPEFAGYARIRMYRVRAFLEGATVSDSRVPIKLQINTTGQILDVDFPRKVDSLHASVGAPAPPSDDEHNDEHHETGSVGSDVTLVNSKVALPRSFIGEPRMVAFEYGPNEAIVCDGYFGLQDDFTRQTPFQEFTLKTRKGSVAIDWNTVKSIRWEFLCEVCAV